VKIDTVVGRRGRARDTRGRLRALRISATMDRTIPAPSHIFGTQPLDARHGLRMANAASYRSYVIAKGKWPRCFWTTFAAIGRLAAMWRRLSTRKPDCGRLIGLVDRTGSRRAIGKLVTTTRPDGQLP
jgi:hypothetical protein